MTTPPRFTQAPRSRRSRSASTLAATMLVVAAVAVFLSISALVTSQFGRYTGRQSGDSDEMAACDAALDYVYSQWKTYTYNAMHGTVNAAPSSAACVPLITGSNAGGMATQFNNYYKGTFAASTGVTCVNLQLYKTDQNGQPASYDTNGQPIFASGAPGKVLTQNVPGYPGWSGYTYNYVAVAEVTASSHFGNPHPVSACRYFQVTQVPLCQAAIFYENKLEIHPGAAMIVTGLVHSNHDLWARSFAGLQFKSNVSYVGSYHEIGDASVTQGWDGNNYGYIPGVNNHGIDLTSMPMNSWADGKTTGSSTSRTGQLNQVTSAIDPFGGASLNNNGLHDIVEVPATPDPNQDQIAYNNASVRILIDDTQTPTVTTGGVTSVNPAYLTVLDKSNNPITPTNPLTKADYNAIAAAVGNGATQTIQDLREAASVNVTSLDMTKLATATVASGGTPATPMQSAFSGTVYIHYKPRPASNPLSSSQRQAVRLTNGRTLTQDVTIATDNGLYIQGDYNTGGTAYTDVPSNNTSNSGYAGGTAANTATGYTWHAAAVMADAVTILSNNWKDSNSSNTSLSARTAVPTTVNAAILAGDVASTTNASGGAHNFPRFLEDWGGINFTYYGSLIEAYNSESFTGKWRTSNVYNWPNRMWNFDTNFINNRQPLGMPQGLQFTRGRWQRIQTISNT